VLLIFLVGSRLLLLFGGSYSVNATNLLWLLAVAAIPMSANNLFLTVARVRKNMYEVFVVSATVGILSLGLGYAMMLEFGLVGVGFGWLAAQATVAFALIMPSKKGRFAKILPPV
jgi:O-antigen/teichoic acid export membrane protein